MLSSPPLLATHTLNSLITDRKLDVLALTETWVKKFDPGYNFLRNEVMPSGYRFFNQDRGTKRGGGVGIVLSDRVKSTQPLVVDISLHAIEFIATRLFPCSTNGLILVVVYRPPSTSTVAFLADLDILLVRLKSICDNLVICGDVNFHLERTSDTPVRDFNSLLSDFNLSIVNPLIPTHNRGHTLDCVAISEGGAPVSVSVDGLGLSDHRCLSFNLSIDLLPGRNLSKPVSRFVRMLKSINIEDFASDLDVSLGQIADSGDIHAYTNNLYGTIKSTLDKHAPLKQLKCRSKNDNIWNDDLKQAKRLCRRAERKFVKSGLEVDRQVLHSYRLTYNRLIKKSKSDFYIERISSCNNRQRELFKVVSDLLGSNSPTLAPAPIGSTSLADSFARFFTGKISKILSSFPAGQSSSQFVPSSGFADFELTMFHSVSAEQVVKARSMKTSAVDFLPQNLLLSVYPSLLPHVTKIINDSLTTGIVPSSFKQAEIKPLLKKPSADPTELASYRPVSNLTFFSKVLESVVAHQLNIYLDKNSLLNPVQSAYRNNHSTETALLHVYSELLVELDRGRSVFLVLLDLSAAFDTINHRMLLQFLNERYHNLVRHSYG